MSQLIALIAAITSLVVAVTALVRVFVHTHKKGTPQ